MDQKTYRSYQSRITRLEVARRGFTLGDRRILAEANRLRECLTAVAERNGADAPEQT